MTVAQNLSQLSTILTAMNSPGTGPPTIARCDPSIEKEALALAAQAWHETERAAYWQAIGGMIRGGQRDLVVLLAAREGDRLLAAQIAQSLPGRAAAVWTPQFARVHEVEADQITAALFEQLTPALAVNGNHLAQALVDLNDSKAARAFTRGGFLHAADLLYLAAEIQGNEEQPKAPFELEPFTPSSSQRLVELIERTYVGTLDCPRIDGLRQTADVVTGYQAVGQFQPELWSIARHQGTDVGCLLVNLHPDVHHAEIVYVALVPEVRGRGWGRLLTQHALWLACQTHSQRVVLAVDVANEPAVQMYLQIGFSAFDRRAVWINPLV